MISLESKQLLAITGLGHVRNAIAPFPVYLSGFASQTYGIFRRAELGPVTHISSSFPGSFTCVFLFTFSSLTHY